MPMTGPERDQGARAVPRPGSPAESPPGPRPGRGAGLPNPRPGVANGDLGPDDADVDRGADAAEARHELITSLARNVTARHDLRDVLATTLAELRGLVRFGGASIQLVDDDGWIRL